MLKRSFILFLSSFLLMSGCAAQTENTSSVIVNEEAVKTITIHADYSAYFDQYGENWSIELPNITSNEDVTVTVENAVIGSFADDSHSSDITVDLSRDVSDLYIQFPTIEIIEKLDEEQKICIKDGAAQDHEDVDINAISFVSGTDNTYQLQIGIEAAERIPETLTFFTNRRSLGTAQRSYSVMAGETVPYQITYAFEIDSKDESILEDAYVTFSRMSRFEVADDAVYSSDDVTLHIVD